MRTVKEMVKDKQVVLFKYYRDGTLWYSTECGFMFPVHVRDIEGTTMPAEDRAMIYMKYIKLQHTLLKEEA